MNTTKFDTLANATNHLTNLGYTDNFIAKDSTIQALYSKKNFKPTELRIDEKYRFEGMTNPSDQSELFAITANDGTKGTLTMSYSAESNQNRELIKQIES
ncbi:hypothetical protein [Ochrovirga pacifica]|uniref:hypothetical protein n=1 Tax=Ochrovirga pacifica TaxID=1042376 RepID=UPI0002557F84|nr:hypothetical protein [Ochrovirga pacifica]